MVNAPHMRPLVCEGHAQAKQFVGNFYGEGSCKGMNREAPLVSLRPERGEESQSTIVKPIVGNPEQAAHRAIDPVCCAENLVRHSVERGHPHILWMNILPDSKEVHDFLEKMENLF